MTDVAAANENTVCGNFKKFRRLCADKSNVAFPVKYLPEAVRNYVDAVSECVQVYPDMPAALSLAVLSLAVQKKAKIAFNNIWDEELNLYVCIFADPAERKSPVYKAMMSPVHQYVTEYNTKNASLIQSYHETKAALEAKKASLIQHGKTEELQKIKEEINSLVPVNYLKLTTSDITAESLAEKMFYNNCRMGIMSDEGGIFDIIGGLYSSGINLNIYLNGYDGAPTNIDRKNGSINLVRPLLTFGVCAQPCILNDLLNNKTFIGRGFVQRFIFVVPPSMVGKRTLDNVNEALFLTAREEYRKLIYRLLELPISDSVITLSPEAKEIFKNYSYRIEAALGKNGAFEDNRDYFGKFSGRTLRIAGILHMAEFGDVNKPLDAYTMRSAIEISNYLIVQSMDIFDGNHNLTVAETVFYKIANKCIKENRNIISYRDIRRLISKKTSDSVLMESLEILIDHGYIAEIPVVKTQYNGRKKPDYEIRPEILKRLASD